MPLPGHLELGAGFFEQYGHDLLIDGVVLGYEDAHGRQIRRDRRLRRARPPEARFFRSNSLRRVERTQRTVMAGMTSTG